MIKLDKQLPTVYLKPGEAYFTTRPELVITVLGSCLSVTMFSRRHRLAGICHALLPEFGDGRMWGTVLADDYRYVDCSIRRMLEVFDRHGVPRSEIELKCFGGANMFKQKTNNERPLSIGKQNIISAEKVIAEQGLTILVKDVGGLRARKILFHSHTGEVLLKRLGAAYEQDLAREITSDG